MAEPSNRVEIDGMGEIAVPAQAHWGAQTERARHNFAVSGWRLPDSLIRELARLKRLAAGVNRDLGLLPPDLAAAVVQAAAEVESGKWTDQFPLDVFQTGSGTSTNMNLNEVVASRANEILGGKRGARRPVHPNDHVNLGQSSNDLIPSAIHVAARRQVELELLPALAELETELTARARDFHPILKIGRTHLQDAVPMRLGQEFGGYAAQVAQARLRLAAAQTALEELPLGGTAVGTGINTHPRFAALVIAGLAQETAMPFREAADHFSAQAAHDALLALSAALKTTALALMKIADDIRWLGSGPRCGLGELRLPEVQAGSSIMPGKVNPVMAESLLQVCAQVIGHDGALTVAGLFSQFELNTMMPLMAYNLLESIAMLARAVAGFSRRCIAGVRADADRCRSMIEESLALVTALVPELGYDAAAALAREAYQRGRTIRELAREKGVLPEEKLTRLLDPLLMVNPNSG